VDDKQIAKRCAILENRMKGIGFVKQGYDPKQQKPPYALYRPDPWYPDPEYSAAFWIGPYVMANGTLFGESTLQLYLTYKSPYTAGIARRILGVLDDGILQAHRMPPGSSHWHPDLKCFCIARFPIDRPELFGLKGIAVNDHEYKTIAQLRECPEVPRKYSGGFERQIQLRADISETGITPSAEGNPSDESQASYQAATRLRYMAR
jgi:hypothetical protein